MVLRIHAKEEKEEAEENFAPKTGRAIMTRLMSKELNQRGLAERECSFPYVPPSRLNLKVHFGLRCRRVL